MDKAQELLYAVVGAGDFAIEKARGARKFADRKTTQKYYRDFVKRGRTLSTKVRNSTPGTSKTTASKTTTSKAAKAS